MDDDDNDSEDADEDIKSVGSATNVNYSSVLIEK